MPRPWPRNHRLALDLYAQPENTFHLVLRAAVGTAPFAGTTGAAAWQLVLDECERPHVKLFAATLMPDHLHLLVSPAERAIPTWVNGFKSFSTRSLRPPGSRNSIWQPDYFDRAIRDEREFADTLRYLLCNPVEAGLAEDEAGWPWTYLAETIEG